MARMEMDCVLKKKLILSIYRFCLGKIAKIQIIVYFLLENSLDVFFLCAL